MSLVPFKERITLMLLVGSFVDNSLTKFQKPKSRLAYRGIELIIPQDEADRPSCKVSEGGGCNV